MEEEKAKNAKMRRKMILISSLFTSSFFSG